MSNPYGDWVMSERTPNGGFDWTPDKHEFGDCQDCEQWEDPLTQCESCGLFLCSQCLLFWHQQFCPESRTRPAVLPSTASWWGCGAPNGGSCCQLVRDQQREETRMRKVMNRAELASHEVSRHGRDYSQSCDGYDDMDVAAKDGWHPISSWGADGWNLGEWPYVVISARVVDGGRLELRQTVEGDTTNYAFETPEDLRAAIDYLFVWYALGNAYDEWLAAGLTSTSREALDAGTLEVPERYRGAYRSVTA